MDPNGLEKFFLANPDPCSWLRCTAGCCSHVAVSIAMGILPYSMGFAVCAALYVTSDEIIPETHRKGQEHAATLGTMLGVAFMLVVDVTLG